jgi:dipeptidyl aminopeptidase/acylaminoacyl peptidase
VATVTVTPSTALLQALGETEQLTATAHDDDGTAMPGKTFTWGSSDENVASVTSEGLVSAIANGAATITATTDGVEGSAAVTVEIVATTGGLRFNAMTLGRNLDPDGYTLIVGGVGTLAISTNDTVTFGELDLGTYSVTIDGLSANCYRFSSQPSAVTIVAGDTIDVLLGVECLDFRGDIALTYTRRDYTLAQVRIAGQPAAGGPPEDLTFSPSFDVAPAWSPDGSRLAFSRNEVVMVVNVDGTSLQSFGDRGPGVGRGTNPAWSPDGMTLAYDDGSNIYVIAVDGTGPHVQLGAGYSPAWSPDGSQIAFEFDGPSAEPEIFVMNADGSARLNLTNRPPLLDREPTWSPDGSQIAFRRLNRGDQNGYELFVMDADGSNQEKLLAIAGPELSPEWLPDNRILFVSSDPSGGGYRIFALDLTAGATVAQLTADGAHYGHSEPSWRPMP